MARSIKKVVIGSGLLLASIGMCFADGYTGNDFKTWASSLINVVSQVELFIQIVATVVGMWFVFSGLQLFRKHHTTQGAQGEHVRNGSGHLIIGILLMCIVPGIQMIQSTLMTKAGDATSQQMFKVDQNALSTSK